MNYRATDEDGRTFEYEIRPLPTKIFWRSKTGKVKFIGYRKVDNWRESLEIL